MGFGSSSSLGATLGSALGGFGTAGRNQTDVLLKLNFNYFYDLYGTLAMHGTLDRYHRQIWTEPHGNPAVPHVFEMMDCSNQVIHLGPISGFTLMLLLIYTLEVSLFQGLENPGRFLQALGRMWRKNVEVYKCGC